MPGTKILQFASGTHRRASGALTGIRVAGLSDLIPVYDSNIHT